MLRRLLLAAVATLVVPLAAIMVPGAANAATTAACTGGVAVSQFAFNPSSVPPGSDSALTLVLRNCTSQTIQGSTAWYGQYTGQGCPVLDPIPFSYSIAPGGTYTLTNSYGDPGFPECQPTALTISANVNVNGAGTVTTVMATLRFNVAGGCHVTYAPSSWPGGFTADVTIASSGSSTINGWTLTFTFPGDQKITSAWNAAVTQTGASVTAANLSYNATISPGGSQSFGLQGTWAADDAAPTSFSVNGTACT
ncbi:MAG: cellulose-binding domain-containing protein [Streptosporangiaceae bacterium]|nr:cellulose-binding domain-containing protein [Streptosporangiaceae bacterium]